MCASRPGYDRNNQVALNQTQGYNNRFNSFKPTPRGRIDEEVLRHPIRVLNDSAFANEKLPKERI
jgi:Ca2+-binding EF-hand superfamily protein